MRRKTPLLLLLLMLFVSLFPAIVSARQFIDPPEDLPWHEGWQTKFPYQRNIYWDFSRDPRFENPDGISGYPLPGAHYEGRLDPILGISDWVALRGDVTWSQDLGNIGIGEQGGGGSAIFHLDNRKDDNPVKNINIEALIKTSNIETLSWGMASPSPGNFMDIVYTPWSEPDTYYVKAFGTLYPNPYWEEIYLNFNVPQGQYLYVDNLHIATECVPEPASMLLLGSGLVGMIGFGKKKSSKSK